MDHAKLLEGYLAGARGDIGPAMRSLPATIDRKLAARVVMELLPRTFFLGKMCKKLPVPVIREVLSRTSDEPAHVFLRIAVPLDGEIAAAWTKAITALCDLDTTYAWGSKQRKAKIRGIAADATMLHAVQATVGHVKNPSSDMLAVLVADGSDASYDALISHIDEAVAQNDDRVDTLSRLRTHATKTPALDALFAELDQALDTRNAKSPALALGPIIGLGEVSMLWFDVWLSSTRTTRNRVPWIQGTIGVDSRSPSWFHVNLSAVEPDDSGKSSYFSSKRDGEDGLRVGKCDAAELPVWLATAAKKLKIEWAKLDPRTHLRGSKRTKLVTWLSSELD